ncbi:MAG: phosphoglycolate phosphatase [Saezia sp.]
MQEDGKIIFKPTKLRVKAIVLDLDGTLVDTRHDFLVALNRTLDDLKLPYIDEGFVTKMIGKGSSYLIEKTLEYVTGVLPEKERQEQACTFYLQHYAQINGSFSTLYLGVKDALETLSSRGYALACLTNKPSKLAGPLLMKMGLLSYFECVFGGDAFASQNPDALPLLRTCEALGVQPRDVIMVGDSVNDSQAARGAKAAVALVRYGYNHGNPIDEVDADFYLNSLKDLPALLYQGDLVTE